MTTTPVAPAKHDIAAKKLFILRENISGGKLILVAKTGEGEYTYLCYLEESCGSSYGIPYGSSTTIDIYISPVEDKKEAT